MELSLNTLARSLIVVSSELKIHFCFRPFASSLVQHLFQLLTYFGQPTRDLLFIPVTRARLMQCGGVAVLSHASVSTDLDDAMRPGFSEVSRSSAGDGGPSVDSPALQRRHSRLGSIQWARGGGEASADATGSRATKRQRNTVVNKVWEWLDEGPVRERAPQQPQQMQAVSTAADSSNAVAGGRPGVDNIQYEVPERLMRLLDGVPASAAAAAIGVDASRATGHTPQQSGRLKRKSSAFDADAVPDEGGSEAACRASEPEPTLECTLDAFNLQVSRLSGDTLAEHNAALLAGLAPGASGPSQSHPAPHSPGAASSPKPRSPLVFRRSYCRLPAAVAGGDGTSPPATSLGFGGLPLPLPPLLSPAAMPAMESPVVSPGGLTFSAAAPERPSPRSLLTQLHLKGGSSGGGDTALGVAAGGGAGGTSRGRTLTPAAANAKKTPQ